MAENNPGGGGNTGLAVLVGALLVAVLVIAFFVFGGEVDTGGGDVNVDIQVPSVPSGGDTGGGNTGGGNQ